MKTTTADRRGCEGTTDRTAESHQRSAESLIAVFAPKIAAGVKKTMPMLNAGDVLTYGHYEQDNNTGNGAEPIEWLVLDTDQENNRVLLISQYGLDAKAYHHETPNPAWEKSDIRAWLNDDFMKAAFTEKEQKGIVIVTNHTTDYWGCGVDGGADAQDRLWLLSCEEAEQYFASEEDRKAVPTVYAVANGAVQYKGDNERCLKDGAGCCWWWLRSPGSLSSFASYVDYDGSRFYNLVCDTGDVVRPAFWLNLASADIQ